MATAFSVFVPASTEAIMTAVPKEKSGGASAITQTTRQLGQALGVAIGGSIAAMGYRSGFSGAGLHLPRGALDRAGSSITGALVVARDLVGGSRGALLGAARLAFMHGVRSALLSSAVLACGGAVFAGLAVPSRRASRHLAEAPGTDLATEAPQ